MAANQEPPAASTLGSVNQLSRLFKLIPPVGTKRGEKALKVAANTRRNRVPPISSAGKNLQAVTPNANAPFRSHAIAIPGKLRSSVLSTPHRSTGTKPGE